MNLHCISESPSLKIVPELWDYWLIKGSPLKLDCIYTRPKNADPETFDFIYNGRVVEHRLDGFEVTFITNTHM